MTQRFTLLALLYITVVGILLPMAQAGPLIWEDDFGAELTELTGADDKQQVVGLNFDFSFFGVDYTEIFVSTNGLICLGADLGVSFHPSLSDDFIGAPGPVIAPFYSDMDLTNHGKIFVNGLDSRVVITWEDVGSFENPDASFTFQTQLMADGRIYFAYDEIPDIGDNLDEDLLIGVSRGRGLGGRQRVNYSNGDLFRPTQSNTAYQFTMNRTLYEVFDEGSKPFDLDASNVAFIPSPSQLQLATGGQSSSAPPPLPPPPPPNPIPEPGTFVLMVMGILAMVGYGWRRRKRG